MPGVTIPRARGFVALSFYLSAARPQAPPPTCLATAVGLPAGAIVQVGDPTLITFAPSAGVVFATASGGVTTFVRIAQGGGVLVVLAGAPGNYDAALLDGAVATEAALPYPNLLVASPFSPDLYFSDQSAIFKIDAAGIVHFFAGSTAGLNGYAGDGGPATAALLSTQLTGLAVAQSGVVYCVDAANNVVRAVSTAGTISTLAGSRSGASGYSDGATLTALFSLTAVPPALAEASGVGNFSAAPLVLAPNGDLFLADPGNSVVRRIHLGSGSVTVSTFAGNRSPASSGDGGPATAAAVGVSGQLAISPDGATLYIGDSDSRIRAVALASGTISTFAGSGITGDTGNGGPALNASIWPTSIAVDANGALWIADYQDNSVRYVRPSTGTIEAFTVTQSLIVQPRAGAHIGAETFALSQEVNYVQGVVVADDNSLFVADTANGVIYKVSPWANLTVIAGSMVLGSSGDNGPATSARIFYVYSLALTSSSLFLVDEASHNVRAVSLATGIITAVAGSPQATQGFAGDSGPATSALLSYPSSIAVASNGDIFISDTSNARVRRVRNGVITTVAGNGASSSSGDGGPAISASLSPGNLALSVDNTILYVCDNNNYLRALDLGSGLISTVAGNGNVEYSDESAVGFGGPAVNANIAVASVTVDAAGNLYLLCGWFIAYIDATTGLLFPLAGRWALPGYIDSADSLQGSLGYGLQGQLAFGPNGALFFADVTNNVVRVMAFASAPLCPPGFACSCGRNAAPCVSSASYCRANSAAPTPVDSGYRAVASSSPFASDLGLAVYVSQEPCPVGSFCEPGTGTVAACRPGTYGTFAMQSSASGCTPCEIGTFLAALGVGSLAFQKASPCVSCPDRSMASSSGAFYCAWWPVNSKSLSEPCGNGTFAFAGPFGGCLAVPEEGSLAVTGSSVIVTTPLRSYSTDIGDSWVKQISTGVVVFCIVASPALLGLVALILVFARLVPDKTPLIRRGLYPVLRALDQIGK